MSYKREMDNLVRALGRQRIPCVMTNGQHWKVIIPDHVPVFMPSSPSGWRSIRNSIAELKKRGVHVKT